MDVRKLLANPLFLWERKEPADKTSLQRLKREGPKNLPVTYLRYLTVCDGGGGAIPDEPGQLSLAPTDEVLGLNAQSDVADKLPGYFVFGSSGDTLFLFDLRAPDGARVCSVSRDTLDETHLRELSSSFSDFLGRALRMRGAP